MTPDATQCPRVFALFRSLHEATDEQMYRAMLELACELERELGVRPMVTPISTRESPTATL